jgi:hypothetical protein
MQKKTHDYDNVFKTMKSRHKRLFISVINETFGKNYSMDTEVETLPSEGYLTESETPDGSKAIEEQISDFVMRIGNEIYLLECQSYDDGSMAIRIAEYAFIVARQFATWDIGHVTVPMPQFAVIYVKRTEQTPRKTTITFTFPNGQSVDYESENVILDEFTKEYIVEKRLFPYIPFYVARYEKELTTGGNIEDAIGDLEYFRNELIRLHKEGELSDDELIDLKGFVNTIVTHITNGNQNEERLVSVMGGTIIETESEKLKRLGAAEGAAQMIVKMGQEFGCDDEEIMKRLQKELNLSSERAADYLAQYGKVLA